MLNLAKPEYKIVKDIYAGYEVQIRRWWHWPFWLQIRINTHPNIESARKFAIQHASTSIYLGRL